MRGGITVVGGRHRGRRLKVPPGRAVRPTAARARKALFDLLVHSPRAGAPFEGARVLDLFAGSGALGIEALSRGAAGATFVERDPAAAGAIRRNLALLGEEGRGSVVQADALRLPPAPDGHALCLADAPYGEGLAAPALARAAAAGWLIRDARAALELDAREPFEAPAGFRMVEERSYGGSRLVLLARAS